MNQTMKGTAASQGIAIGIAHIFLGSDNFEYHEYRIEDTEKEISRFDEAVNQSIANKNSIREKTAKEIGESEAAIFDAHISILKDPTFRKDVINYIVSEKLNAEAAVSKATNNYCHMFECIDDEYLRERSSDFKDVSSSVIRSLMGKTDEALSFQENEFILIAKDLTPSDTAQIDKRKVLGIATDLGGRTSHTTIMARSLEIPAVVSLSSASENIMEGDLIIVDGSEGIVIINPDEAKLNKYRSKRQKYKDEQKEMHLLTHLPATTVDGKRTVQLAINIGSVEDCEAGIKYGAEGVGLFRTEFLYMNRDTLPTEEEQFIAYKDVITKMNPHSVIIRTLDIGGDKFLPYLKLEPEMNPFLGMRAIRLCLGNTGIFKSQLRAILRASYYGKAKIMYPMISGVSELQAANELLYEAMNELEIDNIPYDKAIEKGMMIEIPSAAIIAEHFIDKVDFFSIGSNDLVQYTLAVDRMNQAVAHIYKPLHPAVLKLIKHVIDVSHKAGKWTGMCGEMAGEKKYTPLLIGLGLDEFSMSASSLPSVKNTIRNLDYQKAKLLADEALKLVEPSQVTDLLSDYY